MVGEISATAWVRSSIKERQFAFSCGKDMTARSFEKVVPLAPLVPSYLPGPLCSNCNYAMLVLVQPEPPVRK